MVRVMHTVASSAAIIIVECDEFQHDDRDTSCEVARMTQINEALALEGNTLPILWIRWNPDVFRVNGEKQKVKKKERAAQLVRFLRNLETSAHTLLPESVSIVYMFYDRDDGVGGGFIPPKFALQAEYASLCTLIKDPSLLSAAVKVAEEMKSDEESESESENDDVVEVTKRKSQYA